MKILITNYTFNATGKTITFNGYVSIVLSQILLIVDVTQNQILYNFVDSTKNGTVSTNVLTLTGTGLPSINNSDSLLIYYDDPKFTPIFDSNGNELISQGTLLAGEDLVNNIIHVNQVFSYQNITGDATTTVKSGAGFLHKLIFNAPTFGEVITIYDNIAGSGTLIGTLTISSSQPFPLEYNVSFATGLTLVTATATSDITVAYR